MDLATRKYNFIQKLFEVEENVFEQLEEFLDNNTKTQTISIDQYNIELEQANSRIESGDFITNEEVEKNSAQW